MVTISKCGPDTSGDDYTRLLPYVLFSGHTALFSGPKTAESPLISSKMAAQGPENTIKLKVIISKCGPDISGDVNIHLFSYVLFFGYTALISGPKVAENP